MKKTIIIITLAIASVATLASATGSQRQKAKMEVPDLEEIRHRVSDVNDDFYYPKLREMYQQNDTIMTAEQYRYFYLGYLFQEDFNPYRVSQFSAIPDSLSFKQNHTPQECDSIIKYAEMSLKDNPFDLKQMSFLIYALNTKKKHMRAKIWQYRLENILNTIKNTGTGESPDSAWYVISPEHEYALINAMNYTAVGYDGSIPGIDYITVKMEIPKGQRQRGKVHEGFFFNVVNLQEEYNRKFPPEDYYNETFEEPIETYEGNDSIQNEEYIIETE